MASKPEDIRGKPPFKKIIKCEGVIDYKIIHKIHCKIQAQCVNHPTRTRRRIAWSPRDYNASSHILKTVNEREFGCPTHPTEVTPVPPNTAVSEVQRWIQQHLDQMEQWLQMLNIEDILKHQINYLLDG